MELEEFEEEEDEGGKNNCAAEAEITRTTKLPNIDVG